ncbi:MAG: Asp-tRNA(Asn)/Glu-tRNA(Gln) amidotransferase subunit GatC [Acidimicrobiales bacterium]
MSRITRDDVAHVARLAMLNLTDAELDSYTEQLAAILDHAADIEALELSGVAPTHHPVPLRNVLRPDEPGPTIDRDEVLAVAPAVDDHRFRVPPAMGEAP